MSSTTPAMFAISHANSVQIGVIRSSVGVIKSAKAAMGVILH